MIGLSRNCVTVCVIFTVIMICQTVFAAPNSGRVKRDDEGLAGSNSDVFELNPITSQDLEVNGVVNNRDKRKITETFGAKNAILGFVFGGSRNLLAPATNRPPATKPPPITTTTDDTPDFDRGKVSLDIPDELFGSSFSTVTSVSKIFGDLIMSSARRFSQFVQVFKPLLGKTLTVKGYDIRPTTTTTTESSINDI